MKISEMTNEQAANALIRISEPISNICDNDEVVALLDEFSKMEKLGLVRAVGRMLPKLMAFALKDHKNDIYEIIGALADKTTAEIAAMNFKETVDIARNSYDDILRDFFTSSVPSKGRNENT